MGYSGCHSATFAPSAQTAIHCVLSLLLDFLHTLSKSQFLDFLSSPKTYVLQNTAERSTSYTRTGSVSLTVALCWEQRRGALGAVVWMPHPCRCPGPGWMVPWSSGWHPAQRRNGTGWTLRSFLTQPFHVSVECGCAGTAELLAELSSFYSVCFPSPSPITRHRLVSHPWELL